MFIRFKCDWSHGKNRLIAVVLNLNSSTVLNCLTMGSKKVLLVLVVTIMVLAGGCQRNLTAVRVVSQSQLPGPVEVLQPPLEIPRYFLDGVYHGLRNTETVFAMYRRQHFAPLWIENAMPSEKADSLVNVVLSARRYGLMPQDYHANEITKLSVAREDRAMMMRLDVILTDAFCSFANDLKHGRVRKKSSVSRDSVQLFALRDLLGEHSVRNLLETQEPQYTAYKGLKKALNAILDSISPANQSMLLNGVTNDSVPSHRTVKKIEINLERWRNEKEELNGTYAWINVPAFMFYVIEQNEVVLESRVIVGAPATATPLFSSEIECFTIFPYWYVPRKITVQEYLPVIKKDTTFITRNNFDVLDRNGRVQTLASIDWKQYTANNFPFTLRQREGTENSLGIIKFIFDNPYAVFLHDTNAKRLFRNNQRAYSHGCIRLEKAFEFAHYLIGGGRTKVSGQLLDQYLRAQKRMTISLMAPVPIHIRYYTAEEKDGLLLLHQDIYKKDQGLMQLFYNQRNF